jgi:RNA polymerase sigma-70 factor (ECF subfamily)
MRGSLDFTRLVDQHYAPLYRFALSLTGNESDAGDLVQETFYIWATKGYQLHDASKVKSWLFTTLHRHFLADRRQLVRFPQQELAEVEEELPDVPPELSGRADWAVVVECLGQLDETFRAAVALFYLEEHSYNEIAEILEVPLGTVKSRIARGIAQLQQMLVQRDRSRTRVEPSRQ